mmetsp:Transcript_5652/g.10157  ORF Transcript_5652/g.10157 Transcript_5652/m.10157 type:complete len:85 (-) Transcript_5652:28-282(-)
MLEGTECLNALGGFNDIGSIDLVQRLSITRQSWDVMPVRLPCRDFCVAYFKVEESRVCLYSRNTVYAVDLDANTVFPLLNLIKS